ncbi:MAG: TonB family protein [Kiritimatiellia bacterium]
MISPINKFSLRWSLVLHGILLLLAIAFAVHHRFIRKKPPAPIEFTVVLPEDMPEPVEVTQPAETEPLQEPDPVMPENLPPVKDAVVTRKKPPEPEQKKKPEPKPRPKPVKKKKPVKKTFKKGKRIIKKPKTDFTKLKRATVTKTADKPMSRDEIRKALQAGARPGNRNSVTENEVSRCISLVRRAMYDSWIQPGSAEAGPRPAQLSIRLDSAGRIVSYRIHKSSGSDYFDQSVLKAAARVRQIRGLSSGFLKQYETLTIEFVLD